VGIGYITSTDSIDLFTFTGVSFACASDWSGVAADYAWLLAYTGVLLPSTGVLASATTSSPVGSLASGFGSTAPYSSPPPSWEPPSYYNS